MTKLIYAFATKSAIWGMPGIRLLKLNCLEPERMKVKVHLSRNQSLILVHNFGTWRVLSNQEELSTQLALILLKPNRKEGQ